MTIFFLLFDKTNIDGPTTTRLQELSLLLSTLEATDVVTASLAILTRVRVYRTVSRHELADYVGAQMTRLQSYRQQAVASQSRQLHRVMTRLTPVDLRELRVIVMGPLQPRDGHVVVQFVRQYLHLDEADRGRLLYAENVRTAEDALLLLGEWTATLDTRSFTTPAVWNRSY